ncbi:MAG TPA: DUF4147 domain-containing protein [Myxococcota bacterium]|nr:DUF4147 domain-containing protein [Myxococcota bacterium]
MDEARTPALRALLDEVWREALVAVDAHGATRAALQRWLGGAVPAEPVRVLAVGKAAGAMADGAAEALGGRVAPGSRATLPDGARAAQAPGVVTERAAHPLPDERSRRAGEAALACVQDGAPWVLCLSGGASSLWLAPAAPLDLAGARALTQALLASGRTIEQMNDVRRQVSRVAGGGLLRAAARPPLCVLVLSDVRGGEARAVGSGPCWPDETPEPGSPPSHDRPAHLVVGSNQTLVEAARAVLARRGADVVEATWDEDDDVEALAVRWQARAARVGLARRAAAVSGGEPRVALPRGISAGRGGRCTHLALLVARALAGRAGVAFAAVASDGVDGCSGAAGAIVDGSTWAPGAAEAVARFDAASFLAQRGALVPEAPSGVNVRDLHVVVAEPGRA